MYMHVNEKDVKDNMLRKGLGTTFFIINPHCTEKIEDKYITNTSPYQLIVDKQGREVAYAIILGGVVLYRVIVPPWIFTIPVGE